MMVCFCHRLQDCVRDNVTSGIIRLLARKKIGVLFFALTWKHLGTSRGKPKELNFWGNAFGGLEDFVALGAHENLVSQDVGECIASVFNCIVVIISGFMEI